MTDERRKFQPGLDCCGNGFCFAESVGGRLILECSGCGAKWELLRKEAFPRIDLGRSGTKEWQPTGHHAIRLSKAE